MAERQASIAKIKIFVFMGMCVLCCWLTVQIYDFLLIYNIFSSVLQYFLLCLVAGLVEGTVFAQIAAGVGFEGDGGIHEVGNHLHQTAFE